MRSVVALLVVLLGSVSALGWATSGYSALTSEQARRNEVAHQPVTVPQGHLSLDDATDIWLSSLVANRSRSTLVTFVYTRCTTICVVIGYEFKQLQEQIARRGLSDKVQLLSISFDPEHDTSERMHADPFIWRIGTVRDERDLRKLLDAFGIVVIRDEIGGFQHNAALHVVDPNGRLTDILDLAQPDRALERAITEAAR
jgi:protein SCO1